MSAAVLLAALSALVWGAADYSGGRASRRTSSFSVAVLVEIIGLPVALLGLLVVPGTLHAADIGWSAAAGVAGLGGLVILYRALAAGAITVVAPITGVTGASLPVVFGLVTGAAPSAITLLGVACAVAAIGLVSLGSAATDEGASRPARRSRRRRVRRARTLRRATRRAATTTRRTTTRRTATRRTATRRTAAARRLSGAVEARFVVAALVAGALFGLFFVLLDQTSDDSGLWPIAALRLGSAPVGLLLLRIRRDPLRPPRSVRGWLLVAGVGDIVANALYLAAVREGILTVVAPIAALYPVSTVLLALAVDRERVRPVQVGGLGLAATALVLTAL